MKTIFILFLLMTGCVAEFTQLYGQHPNTDSLKRLLTSNQVTGTDKINSLLLLARYYQQVVSEYDSARLTFDQAIEEAERIQATELLIDATMNKAVLLYYSLGNRGEGSSLYQQSYNLAIKYNHPHKLSRIFYALGIANDHINNDSVSKQYFLKAYDYSTHYKNNADRAKSIVALASNEKPEIQAKYIDEMHQLIREFTDPVILQNAWAFLSEVYEKQGKLKEAVEASEEALVNNRKMQNKVDLANQLSHLAHLCWKAGQTDRIKELWLEVQEFKSVPNYETHGSISRIASIMAKVSAAEGNPSKAYEYETMANEMTVAIADMKLTEQLTEAQIRFETLQKEKEIAFQASRVTYRNRIIFLLAVFVLLTLIALVIIFRNWKKRQALSHKLLEQNRLLEIQKQEIERKREELAASNSSLAYLNENLDNLVRVKTLELTVKNQKLIDYSFLNAHALRGPLARILGLINLIRLEDHSLEKSKLVDMLEAASKELDGTVHTINKIVETDEFSQQ